MKITATMKITVLFPTILEATPYIKKYGSDNVSICGIGLTECAAGTTRAILSERPEIIILAGIAGSYTGSGLHKGDPVMIIRENSADLGALHNSIFVALAANSSDPSANYYTNDTILPDIFPHVVSNSVNTAATTNISQYANSASIENMEGAAFFAICKAFDIKYVELRTISNTVGELPSQWDIPLATTSLAESLHTLIQQFRTL